MLGAPVTTFAYPHGANDDRTRAIIRELGFVAACTTREGGVSSDDVTEALPRLQVRDWGADDLEQHLLWWLGA